MNLRDLHVGMVIKNYKTLCELVGEEAAQGNSRKAQAERFKRYFTWEKADGRALIITDIFDKPKPKPLRNDDVYSEDVLMCLLWDFQNSITSSNADSFESWNRTYSLPQILSVCGFVRRWWSTKPEEARSSLAAFLSFENGQLVSEKRLFNLLNELDLHIRQYCATAIDRSLKRLDDKGYLTSCRKSYWVKSNGTTRRASQEEEERCKEIAGEVRSALGIRRVNLYNGRKYYAMFQSRIKDELGLDGAFPLREVSIDADHLRQITEEEYNKAAERINQHCFEQLLSLQEKDGKEDLGKIYETYESAMAENGELQEWQELFDYTSEDLYEMQYGGGSIEEDWETRKELLYWYVKMGGVESQHEFLSRAK